MIENIYEANLAEARDALELKDFPEIIRCCRELMGLKQFATSEYLGMEKPRYKKVENGGMVRGASAEEIRRLAAFFHLEREWLQKKHNAYIRRVGNKKVDLSRDVWKTVEGAKGVGAGHSRQTDSEGETSDNASQDEGEHVRSTNRYEKDGDLAFTFEDVSGAINRTITVGHDLLSEEIQKHKARKANEQARHR